MLKITMTKKKETKRTVVYEAPGEAVDVQYVQKSALSTPYPETITLTLEW